MLFAEITVKKSAENRFRKGKTVFKTQFTPCSEKFKLFSGFFRKNYDIEEKERTRCVTLRWGRADARLGSPRSRSVTLLHKRETRTIEECEGGGMRIIHLFFGDALRKKS